MVARLPLAALLCEAWPRVARGHACDLWPKQAVEDPLSVEAVSLKGCRADDDYQEVLMSLNDQFAEDYPVPRARLNKTNWFRTYQSFFAPGVQRKSGFDSFEPGVAAFAARGVQGGVLSKRDAEALNALSPFHTEPFDCEMSHVSCALVAGELRVIALSLRVQSSAAWVVPLARLSALRGLLLIIEGDVPLAEVELTTLHWQEIRSLEIRAAGPIDRARERLFSEVIGRLTTLHNLFVQPSKYEEFDFDLASYCGLTEMRAMLLADMNIHSVPDCFSRFRELRYLYLPCNYLTEAPKALAGLPELRAFVAFRQGEYTPCHLRQAAAAEEPSHPPRKNLRDRERLRVAYGDCRPTWETSAGLAKMERQSPAVVCPWVAIRGTLRDWMDLGWPKIEKIWLDGNFISGSIPEDLPSAWPHLRSLDLYNNDLEGEIPASLAGLPWVKLQLHDNRLSGPVPPRLLHSRCCHFNIAFNRNLSGCVPEGVRGPRGGVEAFVGTGLRACARGVGEEL